MVNPCPIVHVQNLRTVHFISILYKYHILVCISYFRRGTLCFTDGKLPECSFGSEQISGCLLTIAVKEVLFRNNSICT